MGVKGAWSRQGESQTKMLKGAYLATAERLLGDMLPCNGFSLIYPTSLTILFPTPRYSSSKPQELLHRAGLWAAW